MNAQKLKQLLHTFFGNSCLNIDIFDAMLGAEKMIPTVDNKVKIKLDPGTQPNKTIRLKGKGLPKYGYNHFGDLYIDISVSIPEKLNNNQIKLIKELKKISK